MSYVVHLWEYPVPRDLSSADSVHKLLAGKPARLNPKWQRLRERVEARMAALGKPLVEWPDGSPPDADHAERTMPILVDEQGDFLESLVEAANAIGLCLYDDQAARLYQPFGYVLTWEGLQRFTVAPPRLGADALDDVIRRCERAWAPRFIALGYSFERKPYDDNVRAHVLLAERRVPAGRQTVEINFNTNNPAGSPEVWVQAFTWLDLPAAALEATKGIHRVEVRGKELRGMSALMTIPTRSIDWVIIGGTLRTQAYVDHLVEGFLDYYDQELGPTLEMMHEPRDVLRLALGDQDAPAELLHSRGVLALAWVQGDATLDRLYARIKDQDRWWMQDLGQPVYDALRKLPRSG